MQRKTHLGFLGDGQNYHIQRWLPSLVRQGLSVTLFTFRPPEVSLDGVQIIHLIAPVAPLRGRLSILDFWLVSGQVKKHLEEQRIDVLYASYATHYGWTGTLTGFHPRIIQTWTFDISTYPVKGWKKYIFGPQVRRVLDTADLITTDGAALAEYMSANYSDLTTPVIPVRWGIDTDEIDELRGKNAFRTVHGIDREAPIIVSGRGLNRVYRPEVALPALAHVLEERSEVHVVVLTLGHERGREIQKSLDTIASHPRGHVLDRFLSRREIAELWLDTDIAVSIPETDGISEGVLEAMYAGAIPVVSDIPSNRSFLNESVNGYYVSGSDSRELSDTIVSIVDGLRSIQGEVRLRNKDWVSQEGSLNGTAALVSKMVRDIAAKE